MHAKWWRALYLAAIVVAAVRCGNFGEDAPVADDGGTASDAIVTDVADGSDGSDGGSAVAPRYCQPGSHFFCDDFDEGELGARWSARNDDGGDLSLDNTVAKSAPSAMRVNVRQLATGSTYVTELSLDGGDVGVAAAATLTFGFDLYVSDFGGGTGELTVAQMRFGSSNSAISATIVAAEVNLVESLTDDAGVNISARYRSGLAITPGKWFRIELVYLGTSSPSARVSVDGTSFGQPLTKARATSPVQIEVGAPRAAGQSAVWTYRIDNVTLDKLP